MLGIQQGTKIIMEFIYIYIYFSVFPIKFYLGRPRDRGPAPRVYILKREKT